jgi:alpha-ketoglutarate-dependent taurine dioxygenase
METERLSPFGVAVHGLNADTLESSAVEIRGLLREHALIVFRHSTLDDAEHVRLVAQVGSVIDEGGTGVFHGHIRHDPEFQLAPGLQAAMSGELAFHSDLTYTRVPPEVLTLQAIELPTTGGATRFANGALALQSLPATMRAAIEGRLARHVHSFTADYEGPRGAKPYAGRHFAADQPMVRRNPRTGRDVLFVTDYSTRQIVGMDVDESTDLLQKIFAHLYGPAHVYVHDWQPDDLLMWENQELQHSRADFDPRQRRILRRVIAGDLESNRRHSAEVGRQLAHQAGDQAVYV